MVSLDDLPTSKLLARALALSREDAESDERWAYVKKLRSRGEMETFEAARGWCDSDDLVERELAADLLAQLGMSVKKEEDKSHLYKTPTLPLLEKLLDDPEPRVIASAVHALGHHQVPEPLLARAHLTSHSCASVRDAMAHALGGAEDALAIELLVKLSSDPDDDIRDWATFGLGDLGSVDTPDIREALFQRLGDPHFDTRSEALVGLAKRNDARVIPFIKAELEAQSVGNLAVEAAGYVASAALVPALEDLVGWWDVDTEMLHAALRRCRGEATPDDDRRWAPDDM